MVVVSGSENEEGRKEEEEEEEGECWKGRERKSEVIDGSRPWPARLEGSNGYIFVRETFSSFFSAFSAEREVTLGTRVCVFGRDGGSFSHSIYGRSRSRQPRQTSSRRC